jgi:hypothetical protein
MFVYKQTESSLWTVGHYDPSGKWEPESDHSTMRAAAERVHWLNGGVTEEQIEELVRRVAQPTVDLKVPR